MQQPQHTGKFPTKYANNSISATQHRKNTTGNLICTVITQRPTAPHCAPFLLRPSVMTADGKDTNQGVVSVNWLIVCTIEDKLSLETFILARSALENSFPTLTLAVKRWPQGEVYSVNHSEDGGCCVKMFAVHSLPDSNGNSARASSNSLALIQNTYQYCVSI